MANELVNPLQALKAEVKEAVVRECNTLYQTKGLLTAQDLVTVASDPNNPLHEVFEWNNDVAAEKYRNQQARMLIRLVTIETTLGDSLPQYVNVRLTESNQRGYVTLDYAMKNQSLKEQILRSALSEARHWDLKYKNYQELAGVIDEAKLDQIEATLDE